MNSMKLDTLKDFIQSANINFLIGSGLSLPYLSTLGNIEKILAGLSSNHSIDERTKDIIAASVYKQYFEDVMQPNHVKNIPDFATEEGKKYKDVILQYRQFLQTWSLILHRRSNSLLSRQVNLYSTNIDIFMERAAEDTRVEFNDGFRGSLSPVLDETMFQKRVMKNSVHYQNTTEVPTFNLLKIHGGINWIDDDGTIKNDSTLSQIEKIQSIIQTTVENGAEFMEVNDLDTMIQDYNFLENPEKTEELIKPFMDAYNRLVMVNPNKSKFSLTVLDAHFYEMIRMLSNSLEKENSLLMVMGFSFEDEHLLNIACRAARRNPTLQIIIFAYEDNCVEGYEEKFKGLPNVCILGPSYLVHEDKKITSKFSFEGVNAVFDHVCKLIPNRNYYG